MQQRPQRRNFNTIVTSQRWGRRPFTEKRAAAEQSQMYMDWLLLCRLQRPFETVQIHVLDAECTNHKYCLSWGHFLTTLKHVLLFFVSVCLSSNVTRPFVFASQGQVQFGFNGPPLEVTTEQRHNELPFCHLQKVNYHRVLIASWSNDNFNESSKASKKMMAGL